MPNSINLTPREIAYKAIERERDRQSLVHPSFDHSEAERLAVLAEEFGEVAQAVVDHTWVGRKVGDQRQNIYRELVHTAAVCVRWLEEIEREHEERGEALRGEDEIERARRHV